MTDDLQGWTGLLTHMPVWALVLYLFGKDVLPRILPIIARLRNRNNDHSNNPGPRTATLISLAVIADQVTRLRQEFDQYREDQGQAQRATETRLNGLVSDLARLQGRLNGL